MSLTAVQSKQAKGTSVTPSVTLDAAPAPDDLVWVVISANENAGDVTMSTPPSGYTQVPDDGDVNKSDGCRLWAYYKTAGVAESATISATISGSRNWTVVAAQYHDSDGGNWILDKHASAKADNKAASTGTTDATAKSNEVWAAAITNVRGGVTQGSPSHGFVVVQTVAGTSTDSGIRTCLYRKIATAAEAASTSVTLSANKEWVGVIATFKTSSTVSASGSATVGITGRAAGFIPTAEPTVKVEAGFGYGPRDNTVVYTNLASYVRSAGWQRGRQNELNQTQAGTGSVTLKDAASHFDPDNAASPFYPNVKPGTPVRATIVNGTSVFPLFKMYAERMPRTVRVTDTYTERQWDLIDGFAILADAGLAGFSYPAQLSGERVNAVLDDIGWPPDARRVDDGVSTIAAVAFADDNDTPAQTHLLAVADSENGLLFCDGRGDLVFIDRHDLIQNAAYTVSAATFTDIP